MESDLIVGDRVLTPSAVGQPVLPTDKDARKDIPITTGVIDYFSAALVEVAKVSKGLSLHLSG